MITKTETDKFGQTVVTHTMPGDITIVATVDNRYEGLPHLNAGTVQVKRGRMTVLTFDHTFAEGAAKELAVALQITYGAGMYEVTSKMYPTLD